MCVSIYYNKIKLTCQVLFFKYFKIHTVTVITISNYYTTKTIACQVLFDIQLLPMCLLYIVTILYASHSAILAYDINRCSYLVIDLPLTIYAVNPFITIALPVTVCTVNPFTTIAGPLIRCSRLSLNQLLCPSSVISRLVIC